MDLGYNKTPMNVNRRTWARAALAKFGTFTGQTVKDDPTDIVTDLLADLMHYCEQEGIDFDRYLERARDHFGVESAQAMDDPEAQSNSPSRKGTR